ncbi:hypothetical protein GJ744_010908 [Endocarpon pusillum]|uniref:Uncharacterized protein n=1 Tax=Endocarpon pusillum TaxID=364733 RepID=A0A8H7AL40_9EURO|nr:hypothetical protein GJ744_010908 [Endocarpon pusillum]
MSSEARPIPPAQFAAALEDLPVENLYAKVSEIRNSIAHLERSNKELEDYSNSAGGDTDCVAAVRENEEVIGRMNGRIELIKNEVERRGQKWHEAEMNGEVDGEAAAGGTLTDEQLRREMEARMAEEDDDAEEGVHL